MNGRVFFTGRERQTEIDELRMQEYARASGFQVDLNTLRWKTSDDESYIMAAETGGRIVSTMRGELIDSMELLERKLECPWSYPMELRMPVLLLSRAATCSSQRTSGLNLLLRYWFLKFAVHHDVRHVIGTFVTGSPRETTLREMGYTFFQNDLGWQQSTYRSLRPVAVVVLDMQKHGEHSLRYCEERLRKSDYSFSQPFPAVKIVRNI